MNSLTINGSIQSTIGSLTSRGDLNMAIYPTGSNVVSDVLNTTTSYTGLPTSSLSDIRYLYAKNDGDYVVYIAKDSSGTNVIATMGVDDVALIPLSGSNSLYVKSDTGASLLTIIINER